MAPAKTYEFLVKDDATRQAMRELWQHVDSLSVTNVFVSTSSTFSLIVNATYNSTTGVWTQTDTTKPSWAAEANASSDWVRILRAPAGASVITWVNQALWQSTGLTLPLNVTLSQMTAGSVLFAGTAGLVSQDNAHLFWVDATNRLGIGALDPDFDLQVTIESSSYPRGIAIYQHSSDIKPPIFIGRKSRGTHAAKTAVLADDLLVEMAADAWDGSGWGFAGAVLLAADQNWSPTAWGNRLEFWTGLNGAVAPQRRWVMDNIGHLWPSDTGVKDIGIISPSDLRPRNVRITGQYYGDVNYSGVIGTPTVDTLREYINQTGSAGFLSVGGNLSLGVAGTINVAAGAGFIRATSAVTDPLLSFEWSASTNLAIPSGTTRYVYARYNGGAPDIVLATDEFDEAPDKILLGFADNEAGTILNVINMGVRLAESVGQAGKMVRRTMFVSRDVRRGGLILGETGTRDVTVTAGHLWLGRSDYTITALDTSGASTFDIYYRDGAGGFTKVAAAGQWPNTQYDDGTGTLNTMTNNRWAALWFYLEIDSDVVMLYGRNQYTSQAAAELEAVPSTTPNRLSSHGVLIGRYVFLKSAATAASISSAFSTTFTSAGVTAHSDLSGLAWTSAGHTGTASRLAAFDGAGAASEVDPTATYVLSIRKAADTLLHGDVTLSAGTNVTLTQVGQDIAIAAAGGGGGTPGGLDTQVQFNDASAFGGDAGLVYVKATNVLSIIGGYLITPTVGVDADSQHILPDVAADTIVLLAATQTLAAKTLTSPVINTPTGNVVTAFSKSGDPLLIGAVTISAGANVTLTQTGQDVSIAASAGTGTPGGNNTEVQFNDSGAFGGDAGLVYVKATNVLSIVGGYLISPTVGVDADSQHTLPNVAADTFALLAATQTLAAKTLTSPTMETSIILKQTTANYTFTWANPAAARAISIIDPLGTDVFAWQDATQTLTNKTLTTPTIGSFTNAQHTHAAAASGGLLGFQTWKRLYANTVAGAAVTSWDVTTGLAGDTDRIYMIFVYVVENATNNVIGMRFNNDSTGTYGDQDITGSSTTTAAARATAATRFPFSFLNAVGARMWCTATVGAISGFERIIQAQIMDQQVTMVGGTTITKTGARTGMWNNTASEINRITVFSSIASGIGIGSRLEIWGTAAV